MRRGRGTSSLASPSRRANVPRSHAGAPPRGARPKNMRAVGAPVLPPQAALPPPEAPAALPHGRRAGHRHGGRARRVQRVVRQRQVRQCRPTTCPPWPRHTARAVAHGVGCARRSPTGRESLPGLLLPRSRQRALVLMRPGLRCAHTALRVRHVAQLPRTRSPFVARRPYRTGTTHA